MNLSDNLILNYFVAYASGVAVSFTPCVYPVMPITASIIGGLNSTGSKSRGFFISLVYVFGMAVMYGSLGIIAALTGKIFGQLQNQPLVFIIVGQILILFSLVMFDIIPLPSLGIDFRKDVRLRNLWSVVLLGMASGLIVGPCTAPVLGTLLLVVASGKQVIYAATLLFVFSYGVGTSLILIGTFSGFLSRLPKSGPWLVWTKRVCGIILLVAGEYFFIKAGRLM